MKRTVLLILAIVVLAAVGGGVWWWLARRDRSAGSLILYGNVDLRQVDLAFNNSDRIEAELVEEGDHVRAGQPLARLDTHRLAPQLDQAQATADAQRQIVARMEHGERPEVIAQARADLQSAQASADSARAQYGRIEQLAQREGAISKQDVDNAKAALDVAQAKVQWSDSGLKLALAGPRAEDIAQAKAVLRADEAQVALLQQQLSDAQLRAPADGVIRSRLLEPGEMASPQRPVFSLAIMSPKWVRAYVSEPDLGKVRPGAAARVWVDSFPDHSFDGWVGFISPVAEFTPKTVQTQELRSSLVYEVRIFVNDPDDQLRLGMPATVTLDSSAPATRPSTDPTTQP